MTSSATDAAKIAGVKTRDLPGLLEKAMSEEMRGLREGRANELAKVVSVGTQLLAERLISEFHLIPITSVAQGLAALAKVTDSVGGHVRSYAKISYTRVVETSDG